MPARLTCKLAAGRMASIARVAATRRFLRSVAALPLAMPELRAEHGYRFSVIAGTIFENTNKPLRDWFRVIH